MSTTALIAKRASTGFLYHVRCYTDGYPKHTGLILHNHYGESWSDSHFKSDINQLLVLGDLYHLDEKLGDKHDFLDWDYFSKNKQSCFMHRDKGQTKPSPDGSMYTTTSGIKELMNKNLWEDYNYIYDGVHGWGWWYQNQIQDIKPFELSDVYFNQYT